MANRFFSYSYRFFSCSIAYFIFVTVSVVLEWIEYCSFTRCCFVKVLSSLLAGLTSNYSWKLLSAIASAFDIVESCPMIELLYSSLTDN